MVENSSESSPGESPPDAAQPSDQDVATARVDSVIAPGRGRVWGLALRWGLGVVVAVVSWRLVSPASVVVPEFEPPMLSDADLVTLRKQCGHCHPFPEPDVLARDSWPATVWDMVGISGYGVNVARPVDPESIVHWYQQRAPQTLEFSTPATADSPRFDSSPTEKLSVPAPDSEHGQPAFVSNLLLSDVVGDARHELLVCDMRNGSVVMASRSADGWQSRILGQVPHPAHAEVADLDADGHQDIIVANLGSAHALDHILGTVEWFRQRGDRDFEQITLCKDLGRVADVQPADLDGDGDVDLVVAEFGWRTTGKLFWLENRLKPDAECRFLERPLDGLRGASHVDVADLNGDGRLEIVALFSQQHERVRVYQNQLPERFEARDIHRAPHPAWGYSGMQCVDMDQDGDVDILLTNGDTFDDLLLKPYHGIQWLEQIGEFQFVLHDVARLPAAYRAEAVDVDGDGDRDIVACSFAEGPQVREQNVVSLVWWEQTAQQTWLRHVIDSGDVNHPTLTVGDVDGDGAPDVLVGRGSFGALAQPIGASPGHGVEIWQNKADTRE